MTHTFRQMARLTFCGIVGATSAWSSTPSGTQIPPPPPLDTVPCAIVLVGHNFAATAADPYETFVVVARDPTNAPQAGATITIDFSACCPDVRLSNTQLCPGVSHVPNSAIVTAITDATGTATFQIEGAASQGGGPSTGLVSPTGCVTITKTPLGSATVVLATTVIVSTPDENGAAGAGGVDVTDLSVFVADKNAYTVSTANYRQRSDFDFHLPAFACAHIFNSTSGFGDNLGDLNEWVRIKNARGSFSNGPFPANCP